MSYFTRYESPVGMLTITSDGTSITGLWIEGQKYFAATIDDSLTEAADLPVLCAACQWLDSYFEGKPTSALKLPLNPKGTPFQQRVWAKLLQIPFGELRTYADIANELAAEDGKTYGSARAVGSANGKNPISIIQPCHRVIGSNHSLTGYAGGLEAKQFLLELEKRHI